MAGEQLTLPGFDVAPLPAPAKAQPIVKWLGGKKWILKLASRGIYQYLAQHRGRYIEPFLGGGALALHLGQPNMIVSDLCKPLIDTYTTVRQNPAQVAWAISALSTQGVDEQSYYRVRDTHYGSKIMEAARFIYLNKLSFNGVYRENKKGKYNVPYGKKFAAGENPFKEQAELQREAEQTAPAAPAPKPSNIQLAKNDSSRAYDTSPYRASVVGRRTNDSIGNLFPSARRLHDFADALKTSDVRACDFRSTIRVARAGDVIFADPPYATTFAAYTADGFGPKDQEDLAACLKEAADRGVAIIMTNSDCPEVRELYQDWAEIITTAEARMVSQDASKRQRAGCVLVTTHPRILGS